MSKRHTGLVMMITGILALTAGLGLGGYNLWDDYRAGIQANLVLDVIIRHQEAAASTDPNQVPELPPELSPDIDRELPAELPTDSDQELPMLEMDGRRYIGSITIPAIDVALPVQEDWSLALLKASPCRYMGSPYQGGLIICAHNYATHFGRLKNLLPGDEVIFTDMDGSRLRYTVVELETLAGTAVEEMESGVWDLTLFTCTLDGQTRVTVRCDLVESTI